ncbi:MAG TPA: hypothetical protein VGM90_12690 [Kofleriaceae bacterium]
MTALLRSLARMLATWYGALAVIVVLATAMLLPGLGRPGLWEPNERQASDRATPTPIPVVPSVSPTGKVTPAPVQKPEDSCTRTAPRDAEARSLQSRAIEFGKDISDTDGGRRLPFALMGLLCVLATAGIAMRLAGGRAAVLTTIVLLAMPMLSMQSRMLTTEIGTACGASLIVYALVAFMRLGAGYGTVLAAIDAAVAVAAMTAGSYLGFYGGGALLGLLVPILAAGLAGMFALPWREKSRGEKIVPFIAWVVAAALIAALVHQIYELKPLSQGMLPAPREVFGKALVSDNCWSRMLGGLWRPDDNVAEIFDSTWEQIAYGTFPWGILAPVAAGALLVGADTDRKRAGALALAWAGTAYIATEVFQRKVGYAIFAGFPALALAIGVWLDDLLARRARSTAESAPTGGLILIAVFFLLAVVTFGKDLYAYPDRMTSLVVGDLGVVGAEPLKYPKESLLLWLPTKLWIFVLGSLTSLAFAFALALWRDGQSAYAVWSRKACRICAVAAIAGTVVIAAFWPFVWQPRLAENLSSKAMFETYDALKKPGDKLVIMGDLGTAATSYAHDKVEMVTGREGLVKALSQPSRVFAIAPEGELCSLHRDLAKQDYFIIDDRNVRSHLLSNKIDGATDHNPLKDSILHTAPTKMRQVPKPDAKIIWDKKIELVGWDIPETMKKGKRYTIKLYYKVLAPPGGKWKVLMHIDGAMRFNAGGCCDHWPIDDVCASGMWQPGDYIVDSYTLTAGGKSFSTGDYQVWIGFFTGTAPNFKNMPISDSPPAMRDSVDRVKVATIHLE